MRNKCWGCGKFVSIGKGTVARVKRFDGQPDQYFCFRCIEDREKLWGERDGKPHGFDEYCKPFGIPEMV